MAIHQPLESDRTTARFETNLPAGLAQELPGLQVAHLPGIDHTMPVGFGTPIITGSEGHEYTPVGPVVPDPRHDGPQLGGHNSGHGPNIDPYEGE